MALNIAEMLGGIGSNLQKADWGTLLPAAGLAYAGLTMPGVAQGFNERAELEKKMQAEKISQQLKLADVLAGLAKAGYEMPEQTNLDLGGTKIPLSMRKFSMETEPPTTPGKGMRWARTIEKDEYGRPSVKWAEQAIKTGGGGGGGTGGVGAKGKLTISQKNQLGQINFAMREATRLFNDLFKGAQYQHEKLPATSILGLNIPVVAGSYGIGKTAPIIKDLDAFKQTITKMSDVGAITESDRDVIGGLIEVIKVAPPEQKREAFQRINARLKNNQLAIQDVVENRPYESETDFQPSPATPSVGGGVAPEGTIIEVDGIEKIKRGGKWVVK